MARARKTEEKGVIPGTDDPLSYQTRFLPGAATLPHDRIIVGRSILERSRTPVMVWESFFMRTRGGIPSVFTIDHIIDYMIYRVLVTDQADRYAGSVAFSTFIGPELFCLSRVLCDKYPNEQFPWNIGKILRDNKFRNTRKLIEKKTGGRRRNRIHARPIWWSDEERLIAACSPCTNGTRDRALIRALVHSGVRVEDLASMTLNQHVREDTHFSGLPAIVFLVPNAKDPRQDEVEVWIIDEAYRDIKKWFDRRVRLPPRFSKFFFCSLKGEKLTSTNVCSIFNNLSKLAGYGPRFFVAHSGRMGYACREAAKIFANGGHESNVYERLISTGLWQSKSKSVMQYCDSSVRRYFEGPYRLTIDEFKALPSMVTHGLTRIHRVHMRGTSTFLHDPKLLLEIVEQWRIPGIKFSSSQNDIRRAIGRFMYKNKPGFREWVHEISTARKVTKNSACQIVSLLLENGWLTPEFQMEVLSEFEKAAVSFQLRFAGADIIKSRNDVHATTARARTTYPVNSIEEAYILRRRLSRQRMNRHVNICILPNGDEYLLSCKGFDQQNPFVRRFPKLEASGIAEPLYVQEDVGYVSETDVPPPDFQAPFEQAAPAAQIVEQSDILEVTDLIDLDEHTPPKVIETIESDEDFLSPPRSLRRALQRQVGALELVDLTLDESEHSPRLQTPRRRLDYETPSTAASERQVKHRRE